MAYSTATTSRWYSRLVAPISIDAGILLHRLWLGAMMMQHGYGKVFGDNAKFMAGVEKMGFPAPELFGWLAALSEFGGGILIALGLGTRLAAPMVMATMGVAGFIRHAPDPFTSKELALTYFAASLVLFILGPGRFSLDAAIARRRSR